VRADWGRQQATANRGIRPQSTIHFWACPVGQAFVGHVEPKRGGLSPTRVNLWLLQQAPGQTEQCLWDVIVMETPWKREGALLWQRLGGGGEIDDRSETGSQAGRTR
jgi:hypothetical protein